MNIALSCTPSDVMFTATSDKLVCLVDRNNRTTILNILDVFMERGNLKLFGRDKVADVTVQGNTITIMEVSGANVSIIHGTCIIR